MGIQDIFSGFSAEARQQKAFDKMVSKLVSRNHQHDERMWCIDQLAKTDTPAATAALFRRWDMTADKKREDVAEKEFLAELLSAKGDSVVPFLRAHNDRSINITWPIQVLRRIVGEEEVVTELLRVLKAEQDRLASFKPEKKLRLLQLLGDYPADPRIPAAVLPSVSDFDGDVRFEVVELLGKLGAEETCGPLVDRLVNSEEDSERVRQSILSALHRSGWSVLDRKDELAPFLGTRYRIGPKGALITAD